MPDHAVCPTAARAPYLSVARSTVGYQSRRAVRDAPVLAVIMVADSGWWHATALLVIALDHAFEAAG